LGAAKVNRYVFKVLSLVLRVEGALDPPKVEVFKDLACSGFFRTKPFRAISSNKACGPSVAQTFSRSQSTSTSLRNSCSPTFFSEPACSVALAASTAVTVLASRGRVKVRRPPTGNAPTKRTGGPHGPGRQG